MTFSELHKQPFFSPFVNSFFHVIFVCREEIKTYSGGKLSCQWLHCLSRIVVINFTHTRGRSPGGGGGGAQQSQDSHLPCPERVHWGRGR